MTAVENEIGVAAVRVFLGSGGIRKHRVLAVRRTSDDAWEGTVACGQIEIAGELDLVAHLGENFSGAVGDLLRGRTAHRRRRLLHGVLCKRDGTHDCK